MLIAECSSEDLFYARQSSCRSNVEKGLANTLPSDPPVHSDVSLFKTYDSGQTMTPLQCFSLLIKAVKLFSEVNKFYRKYSRISHTIA